MKVVSVPQGLKGAVAALALCLPLFALEVILINQPLLWRLPNARIYSRIGFATLPVGVIYVLISGILLRGKKSGIHLVALGGLSWVAWSGWNAIRFHSSTLAFFTFFLAALGFYYVAWLKHQFNRSFFDPRIRWYEGLPKVIPGVECEVRTESDEARFRVSRIDREGIFVIRDNSRLSAGKPVLARKGLRDLVLTYRDRRIHCSGTPVRVFHRMGHESGIGIQFREMAPDARKMLGDFVEILKGEGYVS